MSKTVLYKAGGWDRVHGIDCQKIIVNTVEIAKYLEDGWVTSPQETQGQKVTATKKQAESISRENLEAKAKELGIEFRNNITSKTLLSRIQEALRNR